MKIRRECKKLHVRQCACGLDAIHKIPLRLKAIVRYVLHRHSRHGTLTAYDECWRDRRHKKGFLFILFFLRALGYRLVFVAIRPTAECK